MKYILKTEFNGKWSFSKQRNGKSFIYLAKDENGIIATVDKDWILKNQKTIVNLGVDKNNGIYPLVSPVKIETVEPWGVSVNHKPNRAERRKNR